jgi:hypothetical protein
MFDEEPSTYVYQKQAIRKEHEKYYCTWDANEKL